MKYTITADGSYYYKAELQDSTGKSVGGISPTSGNTTASGTRTLNVVSPSTSGTYTVVVKFYASSSNTTETIAEKNVPLKVVDPIKLTFTLI